MWISFVATPPSEKDGFAGTPGEGLAEEEADGDCDCREDEDDDDYDDGTQYYRNLMHVMQLTHRIIINKTTVTMIKTAISIVKNRYCYDNLWSFLNLL